VSAAKKESSGGGEGKNMWPVLGDWAGSRDNITAQVKDPVCLLLLSEAHSTQRESERESEKARERERKIYSEMV
jgi:hypothetical protein